MSILHSHPDCSASSSSSSSALLNGENYFTFTRTSQTWTVPETGLTPNVFKRCKTGSKISRVHPMLFKTATGSINRPSSTPPGAHSRRAASSHLPATGDTTAMPINDASHLGRVSGTMDSTSAWLAFARSEDHAFSSSAVWAESILSQLDKSTASLDSPNPLRVGVSCFLLAKLCSLLSSRYWHVLRRLLSEVFAAVFEDWTAVAHRFLDTNSPEELTKHSSTIFTERHYFFEAFHDQEELQQAGLLKLHELNAAAEAAHQSALRVSVRQRLEWEDFALRRCFAAWKAYPKTKNMVVDVGKLCQRYDAQVNQLLMRSSFLAWKVFVLFHRSARHHKDSENANTTLAKAQAQAELDVAELSAQLAQTKRENEFRMNMIASQHANELHNNLMIIEELVYDVDRLKLSNEQLLIQVKQFKTSSSKWATLAHEMFADLKGQGSMSHPTAFLMNARLDSEDARDPADLLTYEQGIDQLLLIWVNSYLRQVRGEHKVDSIENFGSDLQDGEKIVHLLAQLFPQQCDLSALEHTNIHARAEAILESLDKIGIPRMLDASDLVTCRPAKNMTFLGFLFAHFSIMNWIGNGLGREALVLPFVCPPIPRGRRSTAGVSSNPLDGENGEGPRSNSLTHNSEAQRLAYLQKKVAKYLDQRSEEIARTRKELQTDPLPVDWDPVILGNAFRTAINANRAWAYLGYHCQQDVVRRLLRLQIVETRDTTLDHKREKMIEVYSDFDMAMIKEFVNVPTEVDKEFFGIREIIRKHFDELKNIFHYYASIDQGLYMTQAGFQLFVKETGIVKLVNKPALERIFLKCAQQQQQSGGGGAGGAKGVSTCIPILQPVNWMETLVRISVFRFRKRNEPIAIGLTTLITDFVLPNAAMSCIDDFKLQNRQPAMQVVLRKHQKGLMRVFKHYAQNSDSHSVIGFSDFLKMANDCRIVDSLFSAAEVLTIFIMVQDAGDDDDDDDDDDAVEDSDMEMNFTEWIDGLSCIVVFKDPAPYLPLAHRFDRFLTKIFFPTLAAVTSQAEGEG